MATHGRLLGVVALGVLAACADTRRSEAAGADSALVEAPPRKSGESRDTPDTTFGPVEGGNRLDASAGMPVLIGVTTAPDGDNLFEKLVFTFRAPRLPHYRVAYVTPPLSDCGPGTPVPIEGQALLDVRFEPTDAHAEVDGQMQVTVERAPSISGIVIEHVQLVCDFEGVVEWGVGLRARTPFHVRELSNPPRLLVELWRSGQ